MPAWQLERGDRLIDLDQRFAVLLDATTANQVVHADEHRDEVGVNLLDEADLLREQIDRGEAVDGRVDDAHRMSSRRLDLQREQRGKVARLMRGTGADRVRIAERHVDGLAALAHLLMSDRALQTSIFVRTRRITSSVYSVVDAWPPRSAVRMPSDTVSSADS